MLGFGRVDAEQKIDERCRLSFSGSWDDGFGKNIERRELLRGQKKWFGVFGGEMSIGGIEESAVQKMLVDRMSGGSEWSENASGQAGENDLCDFAA